MRLDKFVCKSTELTKTEVLHKISLGEVTVNGDIKKNESAQVHENNTIRLNSIKLNTRAFRYILMHKPADTICSNIDEAYPFVFNYLDVEKVSELHIASNSRS